MKRKRGWLLTALLAGFGFSVGAEPDLAVFLHEADSSSPPEVSTSQRFVFRGFDRRDGTRLSVWAEDVPSRLERQLGRSVPFRRFELIRLEAFVSSREPEGAVFVGETAVEGALQQRVVLANPERLEEEALLEAMIQVLLNRYALEFRAKAGPLPAGSVVPDWFSVGMAQALSAEYSRRNHEFVAGRWNEGIAHSVSSVLAMRILPPGRTPEKAYCGALVSWWRERTRGTDAWTDLLRRFAAGEGVDTDWLSDRVPEWKEDRDVEKAWDVWLAGKVGARRVLGDVQIEQVTELKQLLEIRLIDYGLTPTASLPARLAPADLIPYLTEQWTRGLALRLAGALREKGVGQAPELRDVSEAYARYLDGFNAGPNGSLGATILRARLETAELAMSKLEKQVAMHEHLMRTAEGKVERESRHAGPVESVTPVVPSPSLDDLRKRFLDSIAVENP